jgi:hypothetical protein
MTNSELSETQVRRLLREKAAEIGGGRAMAKELSISHSYCWRILTSKCPIPDYAGRAVGYRRTVVWRPVTADPDDLSGGVE